eukprot:1372713-Amorphochlora_amoeboformis.AAC.1
MHRVWTHVIVAVQAHVRVGECIMGLKNMQLGVEAYCHSRPVQTERIGMLTKIYLHLGAAYAINLISLPFYPLAPHGMRETGAHRWVFLLVTRPSDSCHRESLRTLRIFIKDLRKDSPDLQVSLLIISGYSLLNISPGEKVLIF